MLKRYLITLLFAFSLFACRQEEVPLPDSTQSKATKATNVTNVTRGESRGATLFVTNRVDSTISSLWIDALTGFIKLIKTQSIPVTHPTWIASSSLPGDYDTLYVANSTSVTGFSVDRATGNLTPILPGLTIPTGSILTLHGGVLYVPDNAKKIVRFYLASKGRFTEGGSPITVEGGAHSVTLNRGGEYLYISQPGKVQVYQRNSKLEHVLAYSVSIQHPPLPPDPYDAYIPKDLTLIPGVMSVSQRDFANSDTLAVLASVNPRSMGSFHFVNLFEIDRPTGSLTLRGNFSFGDAQSIPMIPTLMIDPESHSLYFAHRSYMIARSIVSGEPTLSLTNDRREPVIRSSDPHMPNGGEFRVFGFDRSGRYAFAVLRPSRGGDQNVIAVLKRDRYGRLTYTNSLPSSLEVGIGGTRSELAATLVW